MSDETLELAGAVDRPGGVALDQSKQLDMMWGVKIPMRDGSLLNATIFKPKNADHKVPAIFTLTPYISDTYHERGIYFAQHDYAFALVDVRGRGNSEGEFEPMVNEGRDGHDVTEWLAAQTWCDGQVTMWGGSYAGFDQWSTLKEFPPHMKTIVPVASGFPSVDFPFPKNIGASYFMQWLTYTSGVTGNTNLFSEADFWIQKFIEMYVNHLPFKDLDKIAGNTSTHFQTWLKNRGPGPYWDAMNPTEGDYARFDVPILTITGHYDGDQNGAMGLYKLHMAHGNPEAISAHYLVIGPWDHAGTRTPRKQFGGLTFGDASLVDMNDLHREWYDWTMKGGQKPAFLKDRVAYYIAGTETWKYAPSLEEMTAEMRPFYLHAPEGGASDVFHSGSLLTEVTESRPDGFTYDPLDTRPGVELESEPLLKPYTDQRFALNLYGAGVVFHTEPFVDALELSGYSKLHAWMSLDVPDTDFEATLYEILKDGSSIFLTSDILRARYRKGTRHEELIVPGEVNEYIFDGFTLFCRQISKGSRLRLVLKCINSPQVEKNYNAGGRVEEESGADAHTAHVTLYHDNQYPSRMELPIGR